MSNFLVTRDTYARIARAAFLAKGFPSGDVEGMVRYLVDAKSAGNGSHDCRKMLHLLELFGPLAGNPHGKVTVVNDAPVMKLWNCGGALGPKVIYDALDVAIDTASKFGVGIVNGIDYSHYGCGFPYAHAATLRGYVCMLWSTASLAEVVPYGGKRPATGTNAWTLGIPGAPGRHFVLDMATSSMARGAVQALEVRARAGENVKLPPDSALDADGNVTLDPLKVVSLLPFGRHKGGGLSMFSELLIALIGGGRPSVRCQSSHPDVVPGERQSTTFMLLILDPKHMWAATSNPGDYAANLQMVTDDMFKDGNESCLLPGEPEQKAIATTERLGGLTFGEADLDVLLGFAHEFGVKNDTGVDFTTADFKTIE